MISKPGIYQMTAEDYHADPCPTPSLSSSGARKMIAECPAIYWHERNNPAEPSDAMNVGSAAHEWVLEGDAWPQRHVILPEDHSNRTKDGKALMAEIEAAGKRPITVAQFEEIKAMRDALVEHDFAGAAFRNGKPELSLFWQDEESGIWCRARPDWTPNAGTIFPDYKTTRNAEPDYLRKAIFDYGYHMQAAWYCDGIKALGICDTPTFLFVFQEKRAPHVVTCVSLTETALEWGRIANRKAKATFAECLRSGRWPAYADDIVALDLPQWADKRLTEKHEAGLFEVAYAMQVPAEAAE